MYHASCKQMQHCWPTTHNIVECGMLLPFACPAACCCAKFETIQNFEPTFLLFRMFRDRRNVVGATMLDPFPQLFQHLETLLGPRTRITHGLQSLKGCTLPTMHCGSEHCRELFAHHSPTRSQQLPTLSGEQYWELLRSFARSFCVISYGISKLIRVRSRWLDIGQVRF